MTIEGNYDLYSRTVVFRAERRCADIVCNLIVHGHWLRLHTEVENQEMGACKNVLECCRESNIHKVHNK